MLRSILAVVLGYISMAVATALSVLLLSLAFGIPATPTQLPPTSFVLAILASALPCAAIGGWVAVRIGKAGSLKHAAVLAIVTLVLGAVYGLFARNEFQPMWYVLLLPVLGAIGVIVGGCVGRIGGRRTSPVIA